ncbi:uncharacterized protein [Solanum tuberosum]|uniref:uncharacterized protein n=1 Tax=Solanum tuberosum TaxID=4113 RepID=UPI00073A4869|nr:PREDICTED: uncharacterized protein LOC107062486 [Solanum tuberosum]
MDNFLIKQPRSSSGPSISSHVAPKAQREIITPSSSNVDCILGVGSLKRDPGERKPIFEYDHNYIRDVVRRHYILMGPYQPKLRVYPKTTFGTRNRQFNPEDLLRQHQVEKLEELLKFGEILTEQGLNQEHGLQRSGDTRWGSHFKTLENFMIIFSSIANVLKDMKEDSPHDLDKLVTALQKKDQDTVNAMVFLNLSKRRIQTMRESGLESLMDEVSSFCVIDLQLQELNNRFYVMTSDLLLGMASLNPVDSFANFSKSRIMKLAEYYKSEFGDNELRDLSYQFDSFIVYARECDSKFLNLKGIKDLATMMAQTELDQTWSLVYLLVKLTLILLVATTSVERAFSSMKLIKNDLRNSIGEEFLNGCLVCKIERKIFENVSNDVIIDRFQNMKSRRVQL